MKTRIVIAAVLAAAGVTVILSDPDDSGPLGTLGWTAVVCVALGAILTVWQRLVERTVRRRCHTVREVPASNGMQVLGTFLKDDEDGDPR